MSAHALIGRERHDAVLVLRLRNAARRNALSLQLRAELIDALEQGMAEASVRVIVLTGDGGHFCSGGDIASMEGVDGLGGRERMRRAQRLVRLITQGEKPVIAAVEGHAAGAGMSLAAACDIVVAARDARFACTFNRIGLAPDLGAAWTLPLRIGMGRARLLMLSGRTIDAVTAERYGLVELVSAPGESLEAAMALAREMSTTAPLSNAFAKALLARMPADLDAVLQAEADAQGLLYATADFAEGRDAFLAKRQPRFTGR